MEFKKSTSLLNAAAVSNQHGRQRSGSSAMITEMLHSRSSGSNSRSIKVITCTLFMAITLTFAFMQITLMERDDFNHRVEQALENRLSTATSSSSTFLRGSNDDFTRATAKVAEAAETMEQLRQRLAPSVWTLAGSNSNKDVASLVKSQLTAAEYNRSMTLCGNFLYSTVTRAVRVQHHDHTFVSTGDIDDMWTRDSAVQMGLYMGRMVDQPWLRLLVEGAIRRQAFNILQDPYANAYERTWTDIHKLELKDRIIGRGGWVATRNYELDSGAYFMTQIYDYYVAQGLYRPDLLLAEPIIVDAVMAMVDVWITEQRHEELSPYRYFELSRDGLGPPVGYTGMTWSGFRPSDDKCQYGYLIPSNIHAAAALERILALNDRIWKLPLLKDKASKLLRDIEDGIRKFGVHVNAKTGKEVYAYEVDGLGNVLSNFDDANVPSLLSIPVLGWTGYDRQVYQNTREMLLNATTNEYFFEGSLLQGIGSPHTPREYVWPMAMSIQALTEPSTDQQVLAAQYLFQIRQSLVSACHDAMHEGVSVDRQCEFTRVWFEWANALFVVLVESALGERCDATGQAAALDAHVQRDARATGDKQPYLYENRYGNKPFATPQYYLGVAAMVPHEQ